MKRGNVMHIFILIAIAILVVVLMTFLSAIPPFSIIYEWTERSNLKFIWYGLVAGIIGFCLILYHSKR